MKKTDNHQQQDFGDETSELNIEELMTVQGGIADDDPDNDKERCGLGCYLGSGTGNGGTDK